MKLNTFITNTTLPCCLQIYNQKLYNIWIVGTYIWWGKCRYKHRSQGRICSARDEDLGLLSFCSSACPGKRWFKISPKPRQIIPESYPLNLLKIRQGGFHISFRGGPPKLSPTGKERANRICIYTLDHQKFIFSGEKC